MQISENTKNNIERLIKYIRKCQVDIFLGSGFSYDAGAPKASDIVDAMLNDGDEEFKSLFSDTPRSLTEVSEEYVKHYGRNDLISLLNKLFVFTPKDTSAQQLLRKIPHFRTIYTTNYDTLIENAYPIDERVLVTSNTGCTYIDDKKVVIYKLHGDITTMNNPDGIIITTSDYNAYFKGNRYDLIWKRLQQSFVQKYVLFIGYSLEDDNIIKIIKEVRKSVNNNMKGMFLVAPNLGNAKISMLSKNGVKYIDSTATEILNKILSELKDKSYLDFKHKELPQEIFADFCRINGDFNTTTTNHEKSNSIDNICVLPNKANDTTIRFTIPNELKEQIEKGEYNHQVFIKGTNIAIPATKLSSSDIQRMEVRVNGIKLADKDDITSLTVAPTYNSSYIKIKVKSLEFCEQVKVYRYSNKNEVDLNIETSLFLLKFTIPTSGARHVKKLNLNITFKEKYDSNNEALKWIDVAIAMCKGEKIKLGKLNVIPDKMSDEKIEELQRMKKYYHVISQIEGDTDISFKHYDAYTFQNYIHALYVYSYYKKSYVVVDIPQNATISFEVDTRDKANVPVSKFESDEFVMCEDRIPGEFSLNGVKFNIPYATSKFLNCKSKSIKKLDDNRYDIVMQNIAPQYYVYCSDNSPRQEIN